jgi:thiol:disulfide interchange protein DsbD
MKRTRSTRDFSIRQAATFLVAAAAVVCASVGETHAGNSQSEHIRVQLVADVQSVKPGTPFWAAVSFEIEDGWYLNWINPGDVGLAPSVAWELPDGFHASEVLWPYPRRFAIGPLVIYGYDKELLLMARITPPDGLAAGSTVRIGVAVDWLAYSDSLVPGGAEIAVTLPVRPSGPATAGDWTRAFEEALLEHPMPSADWSVTAYVDDGERFVIEVRSARLRPPAIWECLFFPSYADVIEHSDRQIFSAMHGGFDLILRRTRMSTMIPHRLSGVLVANPGWDENGSRRAISIDVPLEPR